MPKAPTSWLARDAVAVWHPFTQHSQWLDDERAAEIRQLGTRTGIEVARTGEQTGARECRAAVCHGAWIQPLQDTLILMPPPADGDVGALAEAVTVAPAEVH